MGEFCNIFGSSTRNRVLEYALELQDRDFSVGVMTKLIGISKPKGYEIVERLIRESILQKAVVRGKTQYYKLEDNRRVKFLKKTFNQMLKLILDEEIEKYENPAMQKKVDKLLKSVEECKKAGFSQDDIVAKVKAS